MTLPPLTLVLGGAASGKSDYAEQLVAATDRPMLYIATAQSFDAEMDDKIALHQARRGAGWRTIEAPLNAADAFACAEESEVVLFDCATMWLSNQLFAESNLGDAEVALFSAISDCKAPVVIVSNEVGAGIVPENALARRFRQTQGELNQRIAQRADLVVTVMAGLPLALKGTMPSGAS
ncbi:adenosylcobinamide kinase /adenosylcobinamide-phosphate guanylyltransferase [Aliiroseovarius halocynthiae]|uniref:Bifunctional adenosylcobalamin biosynthesis protein n=1 Tax=Aliiroseovarius halocynthiae TaxID=985055 RepID=A0A545SRH3_9RHOB|nr:bifunctional adenosylcobinamide kinase/adenosylcobinamide-phosphate guanylyltransferase [Aliiroseovarius halocynthiae]TQV67570.1 bifunctional adenosylcobinamide kinase/adenosylcobinamide-phosphate guanylyltransferase [Aliiroseovarius halocynthiae]SMR81586.1 adenosylcobinamide kinase /adenosylcobinamide-phosphate guanylyltransferase [Aliiroseovarius halocynthiae]